MIGFALALAWPLAATAQSTTSFKQPSFHDTVVFSGLTYPTTVRFLPDGRVLVAEKSGIVKTFPNLTTNTATIVADLRTEVYNFWDRGLLGLAVDPNFATNNYVYVLYAYDAPIGGTPPFWGTAGSTSDPCPTPPGANTDGCVVSARLSRLTAVGSNWAPSETPLINDWCQQFPSHSIGSLNFGADGYLYVSGGDGASFTNADYGQFGGGTGSPTPPNPCGDPPVPVGGSQTPPTAEGGALRAQSVLRNAGEPAVLGGAILRIDPATGLGAADNPLAASPDVNARRIIGHGFRNPFRFTIRPGTNDLWIDEVGWGSWEEVNRLNFSPGAGPASNFGWPCYEGVGQSSYSGLNLNTCTNLYAAGTAIPPVFTYNHSATAVPGDGCTIGSSSIAGLAFYTGTSNYPSSYNGSLFFSDYSRQCMWVMLPGGDGAPNPGNIIPFAASVNQGPVDVQLGSDGNVYYVDFNGGKIWRIDYGPIAAASATSPTSGPVPLTINFSSAGSAPAQQGDTITYAWDLDGDGNFNDSTDLNPSYVYNTAGNFNVRLKVTDNHGATNISSPVVVSPGNTPPTATILSPSSSLTWKVGDVISFSGSATDSQQGNLPPSALSWSIIIHHCPSNCHIHLYQTFSGVASGSFPAPDHEYPSWLEIQLTATDSGGLQNTTSVAINPQTVNLTFQTSPQSGLQLTSGTMTGTTPFTQTVIIGSQNTLIAPSPEGTAPANWTFVSWSDAGAQSHTVTATSSPATYTATYQRPAGGALPSPWVDRDIGSVGIPGNAGYTAPTFTVNGSGADIWSTADAFHFAYQPLSGDGQIVARVTFVQNTNAYAKAGVMIRETTNANSKNAMMMITATKGLLFTRRTSTGTTSTSSTGANVAVPYWVKVVRAGTTFSGYASPDGTNWTQVGTATITMATNVFVGLATTSHANTLLCATTFDNVSTGAANNPPTASITSPTNGATFTAPATIVINANAADSDGSVAQVDFYNGSTIIGSSTTAPYSYTWNNVDVGNYTLKVIATDNLGATGQSAPVSISVIPPNNNPPTVSITGPANGAIFTAPGTVVITANAADSDGTVTRVDFYQGSTLLGTSTTSPYKYTWTNVASGGYVLTAVATDNFGAQTTSSPVSITVDNRPTASITAPSNGANYTPPATIVINATAADSDGTVAKVDFYSGATLLGTSTSSPYGYTWNNVGAGNYTLTAVATDNLGVTGTSAPVGVTVGSTGLPPPWLDADIGSVGLVGSASYNNPTFTDVGAGADIWNTADAFHFVYQPLSGDGTIIARVATVQNTNAYAKAGVMIRDTLLANSKNALMTLTATKGLLFTRRTGAGGTSVSTVGAVVSAPYWVKLVRSGTTFSGYSSTDGASWNFLGSATITMGTNVYIGLAVTSHTTSALCTSTFDGVTVSSP